MLNLLPRHLAQLPAFRFHADAEKSAAVVKLAVAVVMIIGRQEEVAIAIVVTIKIVGERIVVIVAAHLICGDLFAESDRLLTFRFPVAGRMHPDIAALSDATAEEKQR